MECPICNKGELQEQTSIKGFFSKRKEIITFCPICDFSKTRKIKLSSEDVEIEKQKIEHEKQIELQKTLNTKEKREIKDTKFKRDSKFDQTFKRE